MRSSYPEEILACFPVGTRPPPQKAVRVLSVCGEVADWHSDVESVLGQVIDARGKVTAYLVGMGLERDQG